MPRKNVRFHPAAGEEVQTAFNWYFERNPLAGRSFLAELDHAVTQVSEAPDRWPRYGPKARRYIFPRFPFSLIYRDFGDEIEIVAVAHGKRKPGYWRDR